MSVYEQLYHPDSMLIYNTVIQLLAEQERKGIFHINCMVVRNKPYVTLGRNETEDQARKVDILCLQMVPHLHMTHNVNEVYQVLRKERRQ